MLVTTDGAAHRATRVCGFVPLLSILHARPRPSATTARATLSGFSETVVQRAAGSFTQWANSIDKVRCPFWRRRAQEANDKFYLLFRFLVSRHASLPLIPIAESQCIAPHGPALSMDERMRRIRDDFEKRQMLVTGNISRELYMPLCEWISPDPDGRVVGAERWSKSTSGLFRRDSSRCDLMELVQLDSNIIRARWRLEGYLSLPFEARIKPYIGHTDFKFNEQGLITSCSETWSISFMEALICLFLPSFGKPPAPAPSCKERNETGFNYTSCATVVTRRNVIHRR